MMLPNPQLVLFRRSALLALLVALSSCGSGAASDDAGSGGALGAGASGLSGGSTATGGAGGLTNSSGGSVASASGGAAQSSGGISSGGSAVTGGTASGGSTTTGGAAAISGGAGGVAGSSASGGALMGGAGSAAAGGAAQGGASGAAGASSAGTGGAGTAGATGADSCAPAAGPLIGWAAVSGNSVPTTVGGEGGGKVLVKDLSALQNAVKGSAAQIIEVQGTITGTISIGSNKTLIGCPGATLKGHIALNGSVNVIVRNLKIVGNNCSDSPSDCSDGDDAISVQKAAHHLWFDHDEVVDGSDGNLDLTHAADYVTISWTKFHYSGKREHQFSNLIGHDDDNASEDTGHLRVTFHHNWWADNVHERMPRVRFGQVHVFNNLYTASGNNYCIGVGHGANILTERNVFVGVKTPLNTTSYSDGASAIKSVANVYMNTSGDAPTDLRAGSVFSPPYPYTLDATSGLEAAIRSGAGPR